MDPSPGDPFALLEQAFEMTAAALRQTEDPGERASRLAGAVRALWPAAPASLCRLTENGREHLRVVGQNGRPGPDERAFPPEAPEGGRWLLQEVGHPARAVLGLALPAGAAPQAEAPLRQ